MEKLKGIDDALVMGMTPTALSNDEYENLKRELKEKLEITEAEKKPLSAYEFSNFFLNECEIYLIHYLERNFLYRGGCYHEIPDSELSTMIFEWTRKHPDLWPISRSHFVKELIVQLKATSYLNKEASLPWDLNEKKEIKNLVVFSNGILDLEEYFATENVDLQPLSPRYFSLSKLPFDFQALPQRPETFLAYLERTQPDKEIQALLQEWAGYNLIYDTTFEAFMFFIGDGANGKSVFLVILKALLGRLNVSSVGLEAFKSDNRFGLAPTFGKLANIDADLSEIDKVAEGALKKYVSGERFPLEKKFKDPVDFDPTARLTFSMNVLPRIVDRSNGIWRRLLVVPWDQTITEEEKRRDLLSEKFWQKSGELPGIYMWALEGLVRLRKKNAFTIPNTVAAMINEYKTDSNPAVKFLIDNLREVSGAQISSHVVYEAYKSYVFGIGHIPINSSYLTKEIKKRFRSAQLSQNAVSQGFGKPRCRVWMNLAMDT